MSRFISISKQNRRLKIRNRSPHTWRHGQTSQTGQTARRFPTQDIHDVILANGLKAGSEVLVKRVQANGKKGVTKIELSILGKAPEPQQLTSGGDNLRDIMEKCLKDAVEVTKTVAGVPFQNEDVRAIRSCLFVARTRAC